MVGLLQALDESQHEYPSVVSVRVDVLAGLADAKPAIDRQALPGDIITVRRGEEHREPL